MTTYCLKVNNLYNYFNLHGTILRCFINMVLMIVSPFDKNQTNDRELHFSTTMEVIFNFSICTANFFSTEFYMYDKTNYIGVCMSFVSKH